MKVIKPNKVSILFRSYESGPECQLSVALTIFFPLEQPARLLPEVALWKFVPEQLGKDAILDMGMPKPDGEVLVTGGCFTPGGRPLSGMKVRVHAGPVDKTLNVYGNRYWRSTAGITRVTDAEPLSQMPIVWQNAFGGEEFPLNPIGKGIAPVQTPKGENLVPLPNIEDPKNLIGAMRERPAPAGFGQYDFMWPQRFSKMGTYDEQWKKERFPGFPLDLDWTAFNTAPQDQWVPGYFKGGEAIEIVGMNSARQTITSKVPLWQPRCFINQSLDPSKLREVGCHAETLWLFPHAERGIFIYRAVAKIDTDDAWDVKHLLVAIEDPGKPKPADHYRQVLVARLDPQRGALAATRDKDLLPEPREFPPLVEEADEMTPLLAPKMLTRRNMRRKAEKELAQAKERMVEMRDSMAKSCEQAGVPVPPIPNFDEMMNMSLPPEPPVPTKADDIDFDEITKQLDKVKEDADKFMAEQQKLFDEQEALTKGKYEKYGVDLEKAKADAMARQGERPRFSAKEHMQRLEDTREMMRSEGVSNPEMERALDDPEFFKSLQDAEKQLDDAYRTNAHYFQPPKALSPEDSAKVRTELLDKLQRRQSLAGFDASGANLAGINLKGANLTQALLVGVNLEGADLSGANLTEACLAHSRCAGLKASGATLTGACLGKANLQGADLSGAILSKALFADSDLAGIKLIGAKLKDADLNLKPKLAGADLSGASWPGAQLVEGDLSGARLVGADLTKAVFIDCTLTQADFSEAQLDSTTILKSKADGIKLRKAKGKKLIAIHETSMAGADCQEASLPGALFRGTNLQGANFAGAFIDRADLSEADVRGGNLSSTSAKEARFNRTNLDGANFASSDLLQASLQRAFMSGTSLKGSNLFSADVMKITISDKTDFNTTNLKRTLLEEGIPTRNSRSS